MFKNQKKKLFTCFALLALVLSSECYASAAATGQNTTPPIAVQSVNTNLASVGLNISSGTASVSASVVGVTGTSKIEITVKLQKYNTSTKSWQKVKSWEKSANSVCTSLGKTYALTSKGTYRAKLTANVWKNGKVETVTLTSGSKTY